MGNREFEEESPSWASSVYFCTFGVSRRNLIHVLETLRKSHLAGVLSSRARPVGLGVHSKESWRGTRLELRNAYWDRRLGRWSLGIKSLDIEFGFRDSRRGGLESEKKFGSHRSCS